MKRRQTQPSFSSTHKRSAATPLWRWLFVLASFCLLRPTFGKRNALPIDLPTDKQYAYVTLLYSDDFLVGVRTLGQSLREAANERRKNIDQVVLLTSSVGHNTQRILEDDGWIVKRVDKVYNPNQSFDDRLHGAYTKLEIFRLIDYHRVVFLDADALVLENIDELFLCGPFCAVMRHSELINTGVMVVEPSTTLYDDMMRKAKMGLYSYTGGDQGFLNSYYGEYSACPYFEPMHQIGLGSDGSKCRRLPHRYNGDWPFLMLNGNLEMVRTKNYMQEEFGEFRRSRVLHYSFAWLKPWHWYSPMFVPFTHLFTDIEARLDQTWRDKQNTRKEVCRLVTGLSFLLFWLLVVLHGDRKTHTHTISRRLGQQGICCHPVKWIYSLLRSQMTPRHNNTSSWTRDPISRGSLLVHFLMGYATLLLGVFMALKVIPKETHVPAMGFSIFFIWTFGVFFSVYSLYLYRWFLLGEAHSAMKSPKTADVDLEQSLLWKSAPSSPTGERRKIVQLHSLSSPALLSPPRQRTSSSASCSSQTNNNTSTSSNMSSSSASTSLQAARRECFSYAVAFILGASYWTLVQMKSPTSGFAHTIPPLVIAGVTLIVSLTVVFYRLPLLCYQEGLLV